jgi:hypothetical protein
MILASGLSFSGLGVKPPEPEWGLMLNTLRPSIYTKPLLAALPGIWLFVVSVSFNLLSVCVSSSDVKKIMSDPMINIQQDPDLGGEQQPLLIVRNLFKRFEIKKFSFLREKNMYMLLMASILKLKKGKP